MSNELSRPMSILPSSRDLFSEFEAEVQKLLTDFFTGAPTAELAKGSCRNYPPLNLSEDETAYYIEAAVPGWQREDISVSVEDGILELAGKRIKELTECRMVIERTIAARNFVRRIQLPDINADNATATMENGILCVKLPKVEPDQPNRVDVKIQ